MKLEVQTLGEFEQLVLLAVLRADNDAYGLSVHAELERCVHRRVAQGAVYLTLDRLEKKGLLLSSLTAPTPQRGGRAKRCYQVTKAAVAALRASRVALLNLWEGLEVFN